MKILLKDIKSARWAIIMIIAYFAFLQKYIYTLCPVTLLTGYPCPGCGMTRALFKIFRFDFVGAWNLHPFIYPIGLLVIMFILCRYILDGRGMKYVKWFMILIAVGMLLFYIWRMYTMFPDEPPMTYYENCYFSRLLDIMQKR